MARMTGLLGFVPAIVTGAFFVGVWYGRSAEREFEAPGIRSLTDSVRVYEDKLTTCSAKLITEMRSTDHMFEWYEQCLDGRACTSAGPPLELWRSFKIPQLPNTCPPWETCTEKPVAQNPK